MSESTIPGTESLKTEILFVQDSRLCPTIPSIPVAISMNLKEVKKRGIKQRVRVLTVLFPAPVGPITLYNRFEIELALSGGPYATMASFVDKSSTDTSVTRDLKKLLTTEVIRSEAFT